MVIVNAADNKQRGRNMTMIKIVIDLEDSAKKIFFYLFYFSKIFIFMAAMWWRCGEDSWSAVQQEVRWAQRAEEPLLWEAADLNEAKARSRLATSEADSYIFV